MARSTKIQKIVTDALATRVTAAESGITTIQARDLVDAGDNVSTLTNDAQYQTQAEVQAKLDALINSAPGTLDTLGEIATALADDDSAIAALVAQDTANATAISAIQTVNTTQDTAIATLQADINIVQNSLNPVLTPITATIEIFIDNVNGSDLSVTPTVNTSPFKTFTRALEFVKNNYYFTDSNNNYIYFTLISNYIFSDQESAIIDGSEIKGSTSLFLSSIDSTPRTISSSYKNPVVFTGFGYELKLYEVSFINSTEVYIHNIPTVYATTVLFKKLTVANCEGFYNTSAGCTFGNITRFIDVFYVDFFSNCTINGDVFITNAFEINFGGNITGGRFCIDGVEFARLVASSLSQASLDAYSYPLFQINNVKQLELNDTITFNSTTGINERQLFNLVNVQEVRSNTNLTLVNTYSSSIINKASALIKLTNCQAEIVNINSGAGFQPAFVAENTSKKLMQLVYSSYKTGTSETAIKTTVYSITGRPVDFDKYSEYLGENYLDLRGKIRRLTLTTDITLTASDASTQNLINQTAGDRNIALPASPVIDQYFEVINHSSSTNNLLFATETVIPSTRHAVQWDGTEWVVM